MCDVPMAFNLYMDGVIREMKAKVGDVGVEMCVNGGKWVLNIILFADDTVLIAESEFDSVCKRRKLKLNIKQKQGNGV